MINDTKTARQSFDGEFSGAEDEENPIEALTNRVIRAARRLCELKAEGVELSEILGGQAGATFVRDYCNADPEVASAAFALVYGPTASRRGVEEKGKEKGKGDDFPGARTSRKQR
jgi:hypothetical protein